MAADENVVASIKPPHYRFTNGNDPIPSMPPPALMEKVYRYRYHHGGSLCRIQQDGSFQRDPKGQEERTFADFISDNLRDIVDSLSTRLSPLNKLAKAKRELARTPFIEDLNDHSAVSYNAQLWNLALGKRS
jgi:hypothetical protein